MSSQYQKLQQTVHERVASALNNAGLVTKEEMALAQKIVEDVMGLRVELATTVFACACSLIAGAVIALVCR